MSKYISHGKYSVQSPCSNECIHKGDTHLHTIPEKIFDKSIKFDITDDTDDAGLKHNGSVFRWIGREIDEFIPPIIECYGHTASCCDCMKYIKHWNITGPFIDEKGDEYYLCGRYFEK